MHVYHLSMGFSPEYRDGRTLSFSVGELTGAIGDSVTVLPIVVAVATLTDLSMAHLLLGFAVFQLVWGLYYGLPVSVEPMKALAALVIVGTLSVAEFALAGLLAGAVLVGVGHTGTLERVGAYVGRPVIRGVQVAVALLLLQTGLSLGSQRVGLAIGATVLALAVAVVGYRRASALVVLAAGFGVTMLTTGLPSPQFPGAATVALPRLGTLSPAVLEATAAQLAMTIGNAAMATALLLGDYFDADVSPDQLATSMGMMNLVAVPLGAMPMCHGSGGVAGKYAFGARTAGANVLLALLYAALALTAVELVVGFPLAMLGVVLALVALELARSGLQTDNVALTAGVGVLGLATNIGIAFACGVVAHSAWRTLEARD